MNSNCAPKLGEGGHIDSKLVEINSKFSKKKKRMYGFDMMCGKIAKLKSYQYAFQDLKCLHLSLLLNRSNLRGYNLNKKILYTKNKYIHYD